MIQKKVIDINNRYYVEITYHDNNIHRLYQLIQKKDDTTIVESFNRDSFLLKANRTQIIINTTITSLFFFMRNRSLIKK